MPRPDTVFKWHTNMPHARHVDLEVARRNLVMDLRAEREEFWPHAGQSFAVGISSAIPLSLTGYAGVTEGQSLSQRLPFLS